MSRISQKIKPGLYKYIAEASLIIFSVLLALLLNEYRENLKQQNLAKKNLSSIKKEIEVNLSTINEWIPYHSEVVKAVENTLHSDSLKSILLSDQGLNIFKIAPRGIFQGNLDQTAWKLSQQNGTIADLDYDIIYDLSRLYDLQENSVKGSLQEVIKVVFSKEALEEEHLHQTLLLLSIRLKVLSELEVALKNRYEAILQQLNQII